MAGRFLVQREGEDAGSAAIPPLGRPCALPDPAALDPAGGTGLVTVDLRAVNRQPGQPADDDDTLAQRMRPLFRKRSAAAPRPECSCR